LCHLSDVPPDTIIDLGSWEGGALANAMRGSKAAELPWWQLIPMDKFVALIFRAIGMRKDDQVMRSLTGFLAQIVRSHDRHRLSFPKEVKLSAGKMWPFILELLEDEAPTLSKYTASLFRTLLPNALSIMDWARQRLLRCVMRFVMVGLRCETSVSSLVMHTKQDRVETIAKCLDFPDFQVQETAVQILLSLHRVQCTSPNTLTMMLPATFHVHWIKLKAAPTSSLSHDVCEELIVFNWNRTNKASAVLSLPVRSSIATTSGFSAESDLGLAWFDVGCFSITCRHKPSEVDGQGPVAPLEIRLSNVCGVHFAEPAESDVLHLELQFSCNFLTSLLYGEQDDGTGPHVVHKLSVQLVVGNKEQKTAFQVHNTAIPAPHSLNN
jgi:hypothetical protein